MNKVICVNTGDKYQGYTERLYNSLSRNLTNPFQFHVLTASDLPGWWGKMEILAQPTQAVYIDMDMIICGNVDFLFEYQGPLCVRRNPWHGTGWADTSLMSLSPKVGRWIADAFFSCPDEIMQRYRSDQEFISAIFPTADTWQEIAPDKTKSYKADHLEAGPDGASIVSFHGEPKPAQLLHIEWIKEHWR